MRGAAIVVVAALAAPSARGYADGFDLSRQAHVATSYGLTLTTAVIGQRFHLARWQAVLLGVGLAAVAGTTKELIDPQFSWGDQLANAAGATTAAVVVFSFQL